MFTAPVRHFLERALATQVPNLEHAFPGCFDWVRLCRATPEMVERASGGRFDLHDTESARALEQRAHDVFRFAHVAAIALLCANGPEEEDPEASLDRFAGPPEEEEEERFERLAAELLGPVEESLIDEAVRLDDRGHHARHLLDQLWPSVEDVLAGSALLGGEDAGPEQGEDDGPEHGEAPDTSPERPVLMALARVAVLLAIFRWMGIAEGEDERVGE